MRISAGQREHNETRIRAAVELLLRGQVPPGGKCDIKTLAREAGVDRTAFYGTRPYARLRKEFENRLQVLHQAGQVPDPRDAQITRLKNEAAILKARLTRRDQVIEELTGFREQALSRLAAQHDELARLRRHADETAKVRRLPARTAAIGPSN